VLGGGEDALNGGLVDSIDGGFNDDLGFDAQARGFAESPKEGSLRRGRVAWGSMTVPSFLANAER